MSRKFSTLGCCALLAALGLCGCANDYDKTTAASGSDRGAAGGANAPTASQVLGAWQLDLAASAERFPNGPAATGVMPGALGLDPAKVREALSRMTYTFHEQGTVTVSALSLDGARQIANEFQWSMEGGRVLLKTPNGGRQHMRLEGSQLIDDSPDGGAFVFARLAG